MALASTSSFSSCVAVALNLAFRKLAWSKIGCIAYITQDGKGIHLGSLIYTPATRSWTHQSHEDPMLVDQLSKFYKGRELASIAWSPSGLELAVVDIYGRLSIFTIFIPINRLAPMKAWTADPEDHANSVVGMLWLNSKRQLGAQFHQPARRQDGQWKYSFTSYDVIGPFNPSGKPALVMINRSANLRLAFQGQDGQWHDVRHEIDGPSTSYDLLTHATFCPDRGEYLDPGLHLLANMLDKMILCSSLFIL